MKSKKYTIILILKMLENESDANHPITQTEIAKTINAAYSCDRKTVGRNIGFLKEIGYPIVKTAKGFYLNQKLFSIEEVTFIVNAINSSAEKSEEDKKKIIDRLSAITNKIRK